MKTYKAYLENEQGCTFDSCESGNKESVKEWARGRGGKYRLTISVYDGQKDIAGGEIPTSIEYYKVSGARVTLDYVDEAPRSYR